MNPSLVPFCRARIGGCVAIAAVVAVAAAPLGGCQIFAFMGVMRREVEENRVRDVAAEYKGLEGKSFAVVVAADRVVRSDYPGVVEEITTRVSEQLYLGAGASGWVPPAAVLAWQYSHPRWIVMPRSELAKELGVDRLVVIELGEFRLNEPGNQYLWAGAAEGIVGVVEAESASGGAYTGASADEFAFQKPVAVRFPDKSGYGPTDIGRTEVASVLLKRFVDRAAWLLYTHPEKGKMDY